MTGQHPFHEMIVHHYDTSPFSEKVRAMMGLKDLAWRSVIQPVIMPKPDLVALTGGYRRIPVMQIGSDIFCDTQVILAEIEGRVRSPMIIHGADWAVNLWADRLFFQATVGVVFGEMGDNVPKEFIADREKLSGRPFNIAAMKSLAKPMQAQWRAHAAWIEDGLIEGEFLGGIMPSLSDVAAYMNIWWLHRAAPAAFQVLMEGLPRTAAWRMRIEALGHGQRKDMTPAEAIAVAKASKPAAAPPHDPADPQGLKPGESVSVSADDYGRDPIVGILVAATPTRIAISRDDPDLGRLHVHFPRVGYVLTREPA